LQAAKTPQAPTGLGTRVSDIVACKIDVGDGSVGFQPICERLSAEKRVEIANYKDPAGAPPGLGTRVSEVVAFKVDVGDGSVGFQPICECLPGRKNCTLQRPP